MKLGELIKLIKETHPDDYEEVRLDFYLMPKNEGMDEDERDDVILKEPVRISYDTDDNAYVELGFKVQESRKENIYGGGILPYKYYFENINIIDIEDKLENAIEVAQQLWECLKRGYTYNEAGVHMRAFRDGKTTVKELVVKDKEDA